jgi:hypothetical protein
MHDWVEVASDGLAAIFRRAEEAVIQFRFRKLPAEQGLSNEARAKPA